MPENLFVTAVLTAKDGRVDELLETLGGLANATRAEAGCLDYGFYRVAEGGNTVLSFEQWVDAAAENAHWDTDHLRHALQTLEPVLASEPTIYKTTKVV